MKSMKSKLVRVEFCFPESARSYTNAELVSSLVRGMEKSGSIAYTGYARKKDLTADLQEMIGDPGTRAVGRLGAAHRRRIEKTIRTVTQKLQKALPLSDVPIFVLVFPWFPKGRDTTLFRGVNASAPYVRVIHLFVDPNAYTAASLRETLAHEWSHLAYYAAHGKKKWTLGDHLVMEGLAEHFRERVVGGKLAPWSRALTKKQAERAWRVLKPFLGSKSKKLYREVFFGGGRFKRWTGYAVGYWKEYF